jgi:hypothetical protein
VSFVLLLLLVAAIPFVAPIVAWVSARRASKRLDALAARLDEQAAHIDLLWSQLSELRRQVSEHPPVQADGAARTAPVSAKPAPAPAAAGPVTPPPTPVEKPALPTRAPIEPRPIEPARDKAPEGATPPPVTPPVSLPRPAAPPVPLARPVASRSIEEPGKSVPRASSETASGAGSVPPSRPPVTAPPVRPPDPPARAFDLENLVGVKLFSAIAGIALVFAAVFFLRYSVEHGWLQPPVRVMIGILVAVSLLVACEMKAARKYPSTANALDAAAIAILFATFFAAHALWNLIPALVTFVLLGVVTAVAVLLSIRRESLFIAVLGLLGGFATPALLSSGENAPVPLFAYLMLLNIGLAWVAYRNTWPLLTAMTLVFTTIYQWAWVLKFLDRNSLTLAMGIFMMFPLATLGGLLLARRRVPGPGQGPADAVFENTALSAAALPLFFAIYLSAIPAYGEHPALLFGFLFLVDAGLLAVALARTNDMLHAAGALATATVFGSWLGSSYTSAGAYPALLFCALFVTFFALAPAIASRLGAALTGPGAEAVYAAPLLLFVPAVLARIEPGFSAPLPLFATLLVLVLLIAWRAVATSRGALYHVAAFFAVATQASWSATHLTVERLGTAVTVYAVFGIVAMAVPIGARRMARPLQPRGAGGLVLIASLCLLFFLSLGPIAPAAIWALALLLAIINAGLFVESGAGGVPLVSVAGSLVSWVVLASWWLRAGAVVGIVPSLTVIAGLALVTMGGHAWVHRQATARLVDAGGISAPATLRNGLYLGLIGHLFLFLVVLNRAWSVPPWPWFATLAVMTLAASAVSLATRTQSLHAAAAIAAAVIVAAWTQAIGASWSTVALLASAAVSAYGLAWMAVARDGTAAAPAAGVLFLGELTACLATAAGGVPFAAIVLSHVVSLALILALTWTNRWRHVALWAVVASFCAAASIDDGPDGWQRLLVLAFAMYCIFIAYPLILGARARNERDPYLAAVLASATFFVFARSALSTGGFGWMIGALPVAQGAVMALLLRQLLRMEAGQQRDNGRLAIVAGAALAFVTVAIPLQLHHQWITIGWAIEGAALAWLFRRIPHRGLLLTAVGLFAAVFVRLALNPDVLRYEPRGDMRILNWYLYAYVICAAAFLVAAWWLAGTADTLPSLPRASRLLPAGAVILLFLLLNIEIADYYAVGPSIMFRVGVSVSQDLTYTIGWLAFGMLLLAACIYLHNRMGRVTALSLIALTTFKCFLYDLGSLGGLYRVASFVGLAMSLALVSLALQKFVLAKPERSV